MVCKVILMSNPTTVLRLCCGCVALSLWLLQLFQEEFVMSWDDLLSSVGGALGLWLGFSVISIGVFCIQLVNKSGNLNIFT